MSPNDRSKPNITPVLSTSVTSGARRPNAAYRQLVARGLEPGEAANVAAYLAGIPIGDHAWMLDEVNHLIFLRELSVAGTLGRNDGHGSDRGT
jgi:hypothetical protein